MTIHYNIWTIFFRPEASQVLWVSVEKARKYCRIAYANRLEDIGQWRSLDDPELLAENVSSKQSMTEMLLKASVPIVSDIWEDLETYVLQSAKGTSRSIMFSTGTVLYTEYTTTHYCIMGSENFRRHRSAFPPCADWLTQFQSISDSRDWISYSLDY